MATNFETEFRVTPNRLVKGMTWGVALMFLCMGTIIPLATYLYDEEGSYVGLMLLIMFAALFSAILAGAWAYSPRSYYLSDKVIRIDRPINSITIPMNKIKKVEEIDFNPLKTIKKWGNSGLFSMTGSFYNKTHGNFWMYAKNDNFVMIHANKKYVLSPDDKELFIKTIGGKIERIKKK